MLTKAQEIVYIAKGSGGVAVGDSRLDGGATPEPGKEESVCCQWRQTHMAVCEAIHKVC